MPYDDVNYLAKYEGMIRRATSRNALEDALSSLTAVYQQGDISPEAYQDLYSLYLAKVQQPVDQWTTDDGAGNTETTTVPPGALPESELAQAGYRRGLEAAGQKIGPGSGELGQYLKGRFAPTFALWGAQSALRGDVNPDPTAFQQYAQQTRGAGLGTEALGTFRDLANRAQQGVDETAQGWAGLQPWIAPENPRQFGNLGALAREAVAGKYGPTMANYFMPDIDELIQRWRTGPTGGQGSDVLAYLKRAFGM